MIRALYRGLLALGWLAWLAEILLTKSGSRPAGILFLLGTALIAASAVVFVRYANRTQGEPR